MIEVMGVRIQATVEGIIEDIRDEALKQGLMKDMRDVGTDIMLTCIYHGEGRERKPSLGVIKESIQRGDIKYPSGTFYCFTCKERGDILKLIGDVMGIGRMDAFKWLLNNYLYSTDSRVINIDVRRSVLRKDILSTDIAEAFHRSYMGEVEAREYLEGKRKIDEEIVRKFKIGYSPEYNTLVFPIFDREGDLRAFKDRSLVGKMYKNEKGTDKGLFGIHLVTPSNRIWLVEGEIDCMTLWGWGIEAISIMGSDISEEQARLLAIVSNEFVIALDNDEAGRKGAKKVVEKLRRYGIKTFNLVYKTNKKDFNEMTKDEFDRLVSVT